jgi:hypothetical protein
MEPRWRDVYKSMGRTYTSGDVVVRRVAITASSRRIET